MELLGSHAPLILDLVGSYNLRKIGFDQSLNKCDLP